MARRGRWSSRLFKAARTANDVGALGSGNPARVARRAKNRLLGRMLRPFWKVLWK
jgi:hypothetical protein